MCETLKFGKKEYCCIIPSLKYCKKCCFIFRLERLQRLAEKIHREAKNCEDNLDEISRRISDEKGRVDVLHPLEAKRNCDSLDRALKTMEDTTRGLFRDVQALQDGRFPTADQLYRRFVSL